MHSYLAGARNWPQRSIVSLLAIHPGSSAWR
jgi:hypothetical protein